MENRNQHMQHAKSGAMRGVAAQPAQAGSLAPARGFKARLSTWKTKASEE